MVRTGHYAFAPRQFHSQCETSGSCQYVGCTATDRTYDLVVDDGNAAGTSCSPGGRAAVVPAVEVLHNAML